MSVLKAFLILCEKSKCEKISICECEVFWHLMWICFCYLYGANLVKTYLQACNLQTSWSISYKSVNQFLIEFAPFEFAPSKSQTKSTLNVKKISHLQMNIFSYFDISHSRRNAFWYGKLTFKPKVQTVGDSSEEIIFYSISMVKQIPKSVDMGQNSKVNLCSK